MALSFDVKQITELLSVSHYQNLFLKAPHQMTVLPFCTLYILKVFKIVTHYFDSFFLEVLCLLSDNKKNDSFNLDYICN